MTLFSGDGRAPAIGTKVLTVDGEELGTIKETSGGCFKVDAAMQRDYWLGMDSVMDTTGGIVRLSFRKDQLGDEKQDSPDIMLGQAPYKDHKGYHPHS